MSSFTYQDLEQFGIDINDAVDAKNCAQLEALDETAGAFCEDQSSDYAACLPGEDILDVFSKKRP